MNCENCRKSEQSRYEAEHFLNASYKILAFYALLLVLAVAFLARRIHELESGRPTTSHCTEV